MTDREIIQKIVAVWDSLEAGKTYPNETIQKWLDDMSPMMAVARKQINAWEDTREYLDYLTMAK